jgi:gamma-glutamyl:cysteine ligase YbdK (ATP-grasp superfamily)
VAAPESEGNDVGRPYPFEIGLFEKLGVELEYMIVDRDTLDVRPIADEILREVSGDDSGDAYPDGEDALVSWSNELVLHVVEMKTTEPTSDLERAAATFQEHTRRINSLLASRNAMLMPGAMHPWMDPNREMKLWPHAYGKVYAAFDSIFGCTGHGWANLQSTHINLPFRDDDEFGRLHAAIRLVLPLIPALAASSPVMDGHVSGLMDNRLEVYRKNSRRVPLVAAKVIPERVFTREEYEGGLLARLYEQIAPLDPEGTLQFEWLNARGAIARFDRGSIEIRVVDIQECPVADCAIVALIAGVVKALSEERWSSTSAQREVEVEPLHDVLLSCIRDAERATVDHAPLLRALGIGAASISAGELWRDMASRVIEKGSMWERPLGTIFEQGSLARRIVAKTGDLPDRERLIEVYRELCACVQEGRMFGA